MNPMDEEARFTVVKPTVDPIQSTLAERGERYGDFRGHAVIAQDILFAMRDAARVTSDGQKQPKGEAWGRLSPVQAQALTVIADKLARILNGNPNYDDNWRDIAGYATLVLERLPK